MKPAELLKTLEQYVGDAQIVAAHPASYLRVLKLDERTLFTRGVTFFMLSVGVVFFLLIPAFWVHGRIIKPEMHELLALFAVIVFGIVFHASFKLFGGAGTLRGTIGAYGFLGGAIAPIHALLLYPTVLKFGPEFVMLSSANAIQTVAERISPTASDVRFMATNFMISGAVEFVLTLIIAIPSFATVHTIGYARSLFALLLPIVLILIVLLS